VKRKRNKPTLRDVASEKGTYDITTGPYTRGKKAERECGKKSSLGQKRGGAANFSRKTGRETRQKNHRGKSGIKTRVPSPKKKTTRERVREETTQIRKMASLEAESATQGNERKHRGTRKDFEELDIVTPKFLRGKTHNKKDGENKNPRRCAQAGCNLRQKKASYAKGKKPSLRERKEKKGAGKKKKKKCG